MKKELKNILCYTYMIHNILVLNYFITVTLIHIFHVYIEDSLIVLPFSSSNSLHRIFNTHLIRKKMCLDLQEI